MNVFSRYENSVRKTLFHNFSKIKPKHEKRIADSTCAYPKTYLCQNLSISEKYLSKLKLNWKTRRGPELQQHLNLLSLYIPLLQINVCYLYTFFKNIWWEKTYSHPSLTLLTNVRLSSLTVYFRDIQNKNCLYLNKWCAFYFKFCFNG